MSPKNSVIPAQNLPHIERIILSENVNNNNLLRIISESTSLEAQLLATISIETINNLYLETKQTAFAMIGAG